MSALAAASTCGGWSTKPLRPGHGGVVHLVGGHHLVDQAERQRLLGVDEPAAEHQVLGLALADRAGQPGRLHRRRNSPARISVAPTLTLSPPTRQSAASASVSPLPSA